LWQAEWLGLVLMGSAVFLAELPPWRQGALRIPVGAYAAALLWLLGAGLVAGALLRTMRGANGAVMSVACGWLRKPSVRHRFAVAALTTALAMTTGMAIMIASFDSTMSEWISRTMRADIYISSAGAQSASSTHQILADTVASIGQDPAVAELATVQHAPITLPDGPSAVLGSDAEFASRHRLHAWINEPDSEWWRSDEPVCVINESLATRLDVGVGASLPVPVPGGTQNVRVVGMYADYGNERGAILVPQTRFRQWFQHENAWRVALMLKPGADAEVVRARLQEAHPGLSLFTQSHLRSEALRIFRQTFAVTYSLEAVGVVVAVAGLGLALAGLMLDRKTDLATLRAVGFSPAQIAATCAWEGLGLAVAGVVAGGVSGLWLGWLLIARVNKQAFGWTLSFQVPWGQLLALAAAVLIVGGLVSAWVGRWSAKLKSEQKE
jgi:putative ABC transport system permease protein